MYIYKHIFFLRTSLRTTEPTSPAGGRQRPGTGRTLHNFSAESAHFQASEHPQNTSVYVNYAVRQGSTIRNDLKKSRRLPGCPDIRVVCTVVKVYQWYTGSIVFNKHIICEYYKTCRCSFGGLKSKICDGTGTNIRSPVLHFADKSQLAAGPQSPYYCHIGSPQTVDMHYKSQSS